MIRWEEGERLTATLGEEIVGLGCQVRSAGGNDPFAAFDPELHWIWLSNTADDPVHNFDISGADVAAALLHLKSQFGEGNVRVHCLWHSHVATERATASDFDVALFPGWLAAVGVVWHFPSDSTTYYDDRGVLSGEESTPEVLSTSYGPTHYA